MQHNKERKLFKSHSLCRLLFELREASLDLSKHLQTESEKRYLPIHPFRMLMRGRRREGRAEQRHPILPPRRCVSKRNFPHFCLCFQTPDCRASTGWLRTRVGVFLLFLLFKWRTCCSYLIWCLRCGEHMGRVELIQTRIETFHTSADACLVHTLENSSPSGKPCPRTREREKQLMGWGE